MEAMMTTEMQKRDERLMRPGDDQPIADTEKAHLGDKPAAGDAPEAGGGAPNAPHPATGKSQP
jgi:hypothetical protein